MATGFPHCWGSLSEAMVSWRLGFRPGQRDVRARVKTTFGCRMRPGFGRGPQVTTGREGLDPPLAPTAYTKLARCRSPALRVRKWR